MMYIVKTCMHLSIYYICTHTTIYANLYAYIYIYIYIYIHIHPHVLVSTKHAEAVDLFGPGVSERTPGA